MVNILCLNFEALTHFPLFFKFPYCFLFACVDPCNLIISFLLTLNASKGDSCPHKPTWCTCILGKFLRAHPTYIGLLQAKRA